MKSFFKKIVYSFYWLFKITIHSYQFKYINRINNIGLKNKTTDLFILGNGKSLNKEFQTLQGQFKDYMVVNRYVLSDTYKTFRPAHYVIIDPHFFYTDEGISILKKIKDDTSWALNLYIPSWKKIQKQVENLFLNDTYISVIPLNMMAFEGFDKFKTILYRYNLSCPKATNVLVAAIYIGICLRYKSIKLYGVEHSWTKLLSINENNEVCLENPHFFDKGSISKKTWYQLFNQKFKLYEVLEMYASMFKSYIELNEFAKKEKVQIINMTKDSFIDAFRRGDSSFS